jgi:hypothetical protein
VARRTALASCAVAVCLTGLAFCYRVYLAFATARLAAMGEADDAVLGLMIDPLCGVEFGVARMLGNPGTLRMMNTLGVVAWGVAFLLSLALVWRLRIPRRQTS